MVFLSCLILPEKHSQEHFASYTGSPSSEIKRKAGIRLSPMDNQIPA